jgi:HEAT repeats
MGWFVLLDCVATLIMYAYLTMGEPSDPHRLFVFNISQGIVVVVAFSLALWGVIWLLCMAFAESAIQGVLCLFVPFYTLFFSVSRWSERRGAFGLTLAPVTAVLISLIIGFAAVGMRKVNDGLYGTSETTNAPESAAPVSPAPPANAPKPQAPWGDGGGGKRVTANAASVRLAENAIRSNVKALRQLVTALSNIHDIPSARANLGNVVFSTRVAETVERRANGIQVGKNEMVALKHSVGPELRSALSDYKQELMRISALLDVPAHIKNDAMAQIERAIDRWVIKPGEETVPALVEESTPFDAVTPNTSVSIGPGRRENMLDNLRATYHNLRQEYGDRVVAVVISGMPGHGDPARGATNRDVTAAVTQRLKELAPEVVRSQMFSANDKMSIVMAPVNDAQGLVAHIDFGTVTLSEDRIEVLLDPRYAAKVPRLPAEAQPAPRTASRQPQARTPDPEVPVGADAVTRSLIELKSSEVHKKKQALDRLQRANPDGRVDQVVQAVIPLLEDDDQFLVNDAIKVLAVWRSPEALPALIGRTRDNRHFVRSEAIKAMGKYQDNGAAEAIVAVFKEDGFAVEAALTEMGPTAEPAVIPLLRSPDPDLRRQACGVLKFIGGQETLKVMQSLPSDPDFGVRVAAQDTWKAIVARVGPPPKPARGTKGGSVIGPGK